MIGDVLNVYDLRNGFLEHLANPLRQGDRGHAAPLATAAHLQVHDVIANVDQADGAAMCRHTGVYPLVEDALDPLGYCQLEPGFGRLAR